MEKWQGWDKIQYEAGLDPHFGTKIASIPGGDKLLACIQCGTCSGVCPLSPYMDYTPRQIVAMIRAGFKAEVLGSYTTWLCASCYSCTVECPKEIKITDVMYAVKRMAIQEGVYPKRFEMPVLANEFFHAVEKNGRSTESWLIVRLYMKTNPFKMLKQAMLGFNLWRRGRMGVGVESIKRKDELHRLFTAMENETRAERRVGQEVRP